MALLDSIINAESGGNPNAKNPLSSATGPGQFIDATWLGLVGKYRPDLTQGKSPQDILALRSDPALSREMVDNYAKDNGQTLTGAGFEANPGNTYLAHFAGPQGALSVLRADPSAPATDVLGPAAAKANPFLAKMTAGDLINWAGKKMGGASAPSATAPPAGGMAAAQPPAPISAQGMGAQQSPAFFGAPQQQQPTGSSAPPQDFFSAMPAQMAMGEPPPLLRRPFRLASFTPPIRRGFY